MLKRTLLLLAIAAGTLLAHSQTSVGDWRVHPFFVGSDLKNLIDVGDKIYYLSSNDLFCLNKSTQENESYNRRNYLNDVTVTGIYYNYEQRYLAVAYESGAIDVIDNNGRVNYLSDIKDATLNHSKSINDITFADGMMIVATQFGYVIYNDTKMEVSESRVYGVDVTSMARVGQWLIMAVGGRLRIASAEAKNENLAAFAELDASLPRMSNAHLLSVNSNTLIVNADNGVRTITLSTASPVATMSDNTLITSRRATTVQPTPTGYLASFTDADRYYTLDKTASNATSVAAEPQIYTAWPNGDGTLWALCADGVHLAADNQNYYKPDAIGIRVGAFYMAFSEGQKRLYLTSASDNLLADFGSKLGSVTQIFAYDGSHWTDVTPANLPGDGASSNWQMAVDPRDAHTYVYPSRKYGVVKVTDDKIVNVYDQTNSLFGGSNYYKGACAFDSEGNLWVVYSSTAASAESARNVAVLPRAKYEQERVSTSDWVSVSVPGTKQQDFKGSNLIVSGNVKVYNSGGYQKAFALWSQPDGITSTPTRANFNSVTDQDGKTISWNYVYSMVADRNGIVWAGLNDGIFSFDPSRAFSNDFIVNHIKVSRNDGTGLADYLLDGSQINCIAVDGANRKWIGTNNSGLFLVSADGSQVLQQFTTENSYLPTNTIYNVCCNPTSNSVYVVTPKGFLEYFGDTTPGASDYSDIHVYPNPVRPDFGGMVTIVGLMDNSLVKIADSGGHVVKQLRSTGGMATWDCIGDNGERVTTGVYYVLASEKEGGSATAAVAKFVVVK